MKAGELFRFSTINLIASTNLEHQGMRGVDEVGGVSLGGALQTQLAVCGHGVIEEGDAVAQFPVVQHLPVVLAQGLARLCLKLELVFVSGPQPVHGTHLVRVQSLTEQIDGAHLPAE